MSDEFENYNKENDKENSYNDSIINNTSNNENNASNNVNNVINNNERNDIENHIKKEVHFKEGQFMENQNEEISNKEHNYSNTVNAQENRAEEQTSTTYRFWADQINSPKEYYDNHFENDQNQNEHRETSSNSFEQGHYSQDNIHQDHNNQGNNYQGNNYQGNYNQGNYYNNNFQQESNGNSYYANEHKEPINDDKSKTNKKKKPFKKVFKFVACAAVFGVIAGVTFIGFNLAFYKLNPDAATLTGNSFSISNKLNLNPITGSDYQIPSTTVSDKAVQQKTDITDIVDSTMPSIVTIDGTFTQTSTDFFGQQVNQEVPGSGSGIIIDKTDDELLIATNNHVVDGAKAITVTFIDDSKAEATVKGKDSTADLAVIAIKLSDLDKKTQDKIKVAKLGNSESIKVGQMAVAIGNALGYGQSVTVGYISAKDREVDIEGNKMVLLQTDAAINPGNSGGALLNIKGEVVGINSVKYASSEVEGMGYAIPISNALPIISELKNKETIADKDKGYLGVYIKQITQEISDMYNWPIGIYVIEAVDGGSAKAAGITAGDIITKVNGTEVTTETQLQELISSNRAGTKVKLTVMRMVDGKYAKKDITVTLGANNNSK